MKITICCLNSWTERDEIEQKFYCTAHCWHWFWCWIGCMYVTGFRLWTFGVAFPCELYVFFQSFGWWCYINIFFHLTLTLSKIIVWGFRLWRAEVTSWFKSPFWACCLITVSGWQVRPFLSSYNFILYPYWGGIYIGLECQLIIP